MMTMIRRLMYTAFLLWGGVCVMTSCQRETLSDMPDGGSGRLKARKTTLITRSVPPNAYFKQNTAYRLWAYDPAKEQDGYMFGPTNGILAKESEGQYIEMSQDYAKLLRGAFDIYGFTDDVSQLNDDSGDAVLKAGGTVDAPTYTITYDENLPEGYRDYYRAYLPYDSEDESKLSSIMEFTHILSRVRVQVVQQDNGKEGKDKEGVYADLRLHTVTLSGVYDTQVYNVIENTFSLSSTGETPSPNRVLKDSSVGEPIIPAEADTTVNPFSESFVFPTLEADKDKVLRLRLTISGEDAGKFSTQQDEQGRYYVEVGLYDRYQVEDDGTYRTPLVFKANHSYLLRVIFADNGVVTFMPMVYPWFDGETDAWENGEGYEEQPLGNTFLFDNLIWSDRNLGADHFYPTDRASFEKCTGFFYQFGRNIPYFPMDNKDNVLTDLLQDGTDMYPVVSDPKGKLQKPYQKDSTSSDDTPASIPFVTELEEMDPKRIADGTQLLSYNCWPNGFDNNLWDDVLTQPTPPGWRLPMQEELFSILPSTPYAGNITFMRNIRWRSATDEAGGAKSAVFDDRYNILYLNIPPDSDHPNYPPKGLPSDDPGSYLGGGAPDDGENYMPAGDPYEGYSSEYLISKKYTDEFSKPVKSLYDDDRNYWGVIYAIKKVGTDEAYRMRWRIENSDPSGNFYVLVIERYPATAKDRLSYKENDSNYYRKYNWERPTAVLYIPLVGMVGDAKWTQRSGQLGNFGVETILATSEGIDGKIQHSGYWFSAYKTYRIKIHGTDRLNQFLYPAVDRRGSGAQIRLVRESTYQPDR